MQLRAAHRRNRRKNRKDGKEEDTSDFVSLRTQLEGLGLTLRDIPGDGWVECVRICLLCGDLLGKSHNRMLLYCAASEQSGSCSSACRSDLHLKRASSLKRKSCKYCCRNCLFRAFSDQLYGTSDRHAEIRRDVVDFMRSNAQDFEPFLVDEVSFDRHLELLGRDGTFGGTRRPRTSQTTDSAHDSSTSSQGMTPSWRLPAFTA